MKEIMKFSLFILFFAVVLVSCSKEKIKNHCKIYKISQ